MSNKKTYSVVVPFAGHVEINVTTDIDPEEPGDDWVSASPFQLACIDAASEQTEINITTSEGEWLEGMWNFYSQIVQGNFLFIDTNEVEILEIIEDEEE